MGDTDLPSACSSSVATDPYMIRFSASARRVRPAEAYSDYGFIAVLALIQRLTIDLLLMTWQAGFAFKRFFKSKVLDNPYREVVQEIVVLRHPAVRDHLYIVQLIGVCWDIPDSNHVWPVLVFEKTHLGNLDHFMRSGNRRNLRLEDKLKFCVEIDIIHGDVKPKNVLIFEEETGLYTTKVADFGFSTYFYEEQEDLIQMPESVLWTALEHHSNYHTSQSAKPWTCTPSSCLDPDTKKQNADRDHLLSCLAPAQPTFDYNPLLSHSLKRE
ncbi:hypothetical protein K491DRAFT_763773 [Lophiostoma macrostomum CBS 122681]|uniref:Protein kinase domain-containing protein n=1 Tax=Lophiostoma macrostomum CBS 122681 TaxID=1314788 RepID=A0A6A6SI75_9PLEO|nr:hypothetical protein K491DRAFT_763773 [Lophiostoma macrostomum CBS 122681]